MQDVDEEVSRRQALEFYLMRGLWGEVHPQLRQASIEADRATRTVRVRFEYDGEPSPDALECGSCAASEVFACFPATWELDEQHVAAPRSGGLSQLEYLVYLRWEPERYVE
ncbi:hypothetical protein [Noviluteimonas gilva]|uniref:Uncharacterized protein n=1 Tax=Noviluteimonas gilva TaxID=2682097 RepID=A0A7C9I0U0_9GAMM|nr:hypothetical protein [Lysobacter gilvus]MUV15794.1 hypothetical protein [Lysobacter gilvus]